MTIVDPQDALRRYFGHPGFRRGQQQAVEAALAGRDVLLVMPTGAGKSVCYQLPALVDGRLAVVVSPLVSLMQDQVEGLGEHAALINAQRDGAENRSTLARALAGEVRLLYVAPERFAAPGFTARLAEAEIGLFVVDEAHCVSQWGHDFRPDYFRLGEVARELGAASIFAATATATPRVAGDVIRRLELRHPVRITTGFDRPNLAYDVVPIRSQRHKQAATLALLDGEDALPAIVYAGTRKKTEATAAWLERELGVHVPRYHAGMERDERAEAQRMFMRGESPVVVATNAFGMGVDKSNVRTVIHEVVPSSLEAYYQEAGRAGRDGRASRCVLLAENRDKGLHVFFINQIESAEAKSHRWRQYREVWAYVEGGGCRRQAILRHFGDRAQAYAEGRCCDVCDGLLELPEPRAQLEPAATDGHAAQGGATSHGAHGGATSNGAGAQGGATSHGGGATAGIAASTVGRPELDEAIFTVVAEAQPQVGRTRAVEILRGGRSKVVVQHGYDELPHYGAFGDWRREEVLERVDALLDAGRLRSTGGRFPKLAFAGGGSRPLPGNGGTSGREEAGPADVRPEPTGEFRIAVLASGTGTNLQAILDTVHGHHGIAVVAVGSDKPGAPALQRADSAGIATSLFPRQDYGSREARDAAIADWLEGMSVNLVVLAGYMQLLTTAFVHRFRNRVINVHPALLPSFPGLDAIGQALAHGVAVTGVTVHFVDEGVDSGPILLQRPIAVPPDRDRDALEATIHAAEHLLLPEAIRLIAARRVEIDRDNPRIVRIAPPPDPPSAA